VADPVLRLAKELRDLRSVTGLSLRELQRLTHTSDSSLSRYFAGRIRPPWTVLEALCRLAGRDAEDLRPLWQAAFRMGGAPAGVGPGPDDDSATTPRQLPAAPRFFVGRAHEIKMLTEAVESAEAPGPVLITGMAGVGKTALAVHWAHQVADRYPDGQLFLNLRGFDPAGAPVTGHGAGMILLESLGVPARKIPDDPAARSALLRSVVADLRLLIVLDNAADATQIRPLLPGTAASQVVVTSRLRLTGLVASDGVRPLTVGVLDRTDAAGLLSRRVGAERVREDGASVARLIDDCAGLPLALNIVAARMQSDTALTWRDLLARLRESSSALTALEADDTVIDLRAVFHLSYRRLGTEAARMFRLLSLHPGPDISLPTAASLAGRPRAEAARALDELTDAHLLTAAAGRFTQHDLLRAFSKETAREETEKGREEARRRMFDHYLHSGVAAEQIVSPARSMTLPKAEPGTTPESFTDPDAARIWIETEARNLLALIALASSMDAAAYEHRLPWVLTTYLDHRGDWRTLSGLLDAAAEAADRTATPAERAIAHNNAAQSYVRLAEYKSALAHLDEARALWSALDDHAGVAKVDHVMAVVEDARGDYAKALEHVQNSLARSEAAGARGGIANAMSMLAWLNVRLGDHPQALVHANRAIALHHALGDRSSESQARDTAGLAHFEMAQYPEALDCYRMALEHAQQQGEPFNEARTWRKIARAREALAQPAAAREAWEAALALFEELGLPDADEIRDHLGPSGPCALRPDFPEKDQEA
jgi:tetratricopeptide (TPR) repeat protein/transcriptional regulator with XRE-family HTH domain